MYLRASWGQTHRRQCLCNALVAAAPLAGRQQVKRFGDQARDLVARVEAAEGVLKHHLHFAAHGRLGCCPEHRPPSVDCADLHGSSPRMARVRVDFPQPLSPTRPHAFAAFDVKTDPLSAPP